MTWNFPIPFHASSYISQIQPILKFQAEALIILVIQMAAAAILDFQN